MVTRAVKTLPWTLRALEFYGTRMHHRGLWRVHPWLRRLAKVDIDCDMEVTRNGLTWLLNPSDFTQCEFFWTGLLDTWDMYHVVRLLKPGSVIFDIGANFGYYSILACAQLEGRCQCYAFEPNAPSFARLTKNIELNGLGEQIKASSKALSDTVGTGWMVEHVGNSGDARVSTVGGARPISLTSLDDFCITHGVDRIDFVKIDVQGYEEKVLLGGKNMLTQLRPPILIEMDPPVLRAQGCSENRIVETLVSYGYRLYIADQKRLVPFQLPVKNDLANVFCLP
jgi:FkbM family methyltransferase